MTKQDEYVAIADGIGIVKVDYGIDDYIVFRDMGKPQKLHRAKINYMGREYFKYSGRRFYLDECIRTHVF